MQVSQVGLWVYLLSGPIGALLAFAIMAMWK